MSIALDRRRTLGELSARSESLVQLVRQHRPRPLRRSTPDLPRPQHLPQHLGNAWAAEEAEGGKSFFGTIWDVQKTASTWEWAVAVGTMSWSNDRFVCAIF